MLSLVLLLLAQPLSVRPSALTLTPGQRATVRVNAQPTQVEASDRHTLLELTPGGRLTVQAPPYAKDVSILIRSNDDFVVLPVRVVEPGPVPPAARLVLGLSQSGASSARASLHYFFDFYTVRPLTAGFRLWGNVRIASAPQQLDIPVAQFAPDFFKVLGEIEVNKLALGGEFLTGLEIRTFRSLGVVSFFGASGAFSDPVARARVFKTGPDQYLGLLPQDRERFYRQYGAGIRHWSPQSGTFTATLGQDQAVTGGRYHRPVLRIDTLHPLRRYGLYLIATATLSVAKPHTPLTLAAYEPAPDVPIHDPRVTLRAVSSSRDSYRIGIGIDLARLLDSR